MSHEFWDGCGDRWVWDHHDQLWFRDGRDPDLEPGVTEPGALPAERQPFYAHPPNAAQRTARDLAEEAP